MSKLTDLDATEIARRVGKGEISISEVCSAFQDRAADLNEGINAVVTFNDDALTQAKAADDRLAAGEPARPLEGVPFVVKDNIPTAGLRTTFGSLVHETNVPKESAIVVQRLQAAGGILMGKTNTSEFATDVNTTNRIFGLTRNPLDPFVSAGGSSGGTAAAIVSDMAPIGLGTDHGGSIRIPAAWGGISGLRPSPGRVPVYPAEFAWDTLVAHVQGPLARTVRDLGLMLSILAGQDDRDPSSLPDPDADYIVAARDGSPLRGRKIALCMDLGGVMPLDPEVAEAVRAAAAAFAQQGAIVEEACFDASDIRDIIAGTRSFGVIGRFSELLEEHAPKLTKQLVNQIEGAASQSLASVARAERLRSAYWRRVRNFLERYEFILTPTIGALPFRIDQPLPNHIGGVEVENYYDVFLGVYAFSLVGLPAISVPCGVSKSGLPISLQIVGHRLRDDKVLAAAASYARACPQHFERRPIRRPEGRLDYEVDTPGTRTAKT